MNSRKIKKESTFKLFVETGFGQCCFYLAFGVATYAAFYFGIA